MELQVHAVCSLGACPVLLRTMCNACHHAVVGLTNHGKAELEEEWAATHQQGAWRLVVPQPPNTGTALLSGPPCLLVLLFALCAGCLGGRCMSGM